jgi:hypothetical protein
MLLAYVFGLAAAYWAIPGVVAIASRGWFARPPLDTVTA